MTAEAQCVLNCDKRTRAVADGWSGLWFKHQVWFGLFGLVVRCATTRRTATVRRTGPLPSASTKALEEASTAGPPGWQVDASFLTAFLQSFLPSFFYSLLPSSPSFLSSPQSFFQTSAIHPNSFFPSFLACFHPSFLC